MNTLTNKQKYALMQGNVIDLVAGGFTAITSNSDSTPTTINYALMFGDKIVADIEFGDDADIVGITPPFKFIAGNEGAIQANAAVANATVQFLKNSSALSDAVACATDKAVTAVGTVDDDYSTLDTTDTLNIKNVSAGAKAVATLTFTPALT